MFYQMITNARDRWFSSPACTAREVVKYIEQTNQMRDAQVDAIKTYLYLKIACGCVPLSQLFCQGAFNTLDLEQEEISASIRDFLATHPAAAALFEYARLKNDSGEQVSEMLEKQIRKDPESIDYEIFFQKAFYGVSYTDYLFSLPMGAGKTYLMAAFIYLDLYFARNEPNNPAFAHNFMIFAPSGLKSSVVPSLKTIQRFDPTWVIPEPAASEIKRLLSFEVLDQSKTAKKSNKTKNPNVQKIANHQPLSELFGLVAVTNAEKVILDRIQEKAGQISMFEESDDEKDRQANELRNLIGKLPALSVFIDEVHHAVSDEIKLRAVVNKWAENQTINSVVGFSGTPYLEKAEKIQVTDGLSVSSAEISNIVYYYPLIDGVGNFLKRPIVKIAELPDSGRIIDRGVREFLDNYKDTVYPDGTCAKLGIYCGTIEKLEELVYPLVAGITAEYGLSADCILKFHKGNKQYPQPADSQMEFDSLDQPFSKVRIILLVQIGKEGWDCRSLTGIILSQEGDCPKNMVLQTACRCLRQVQKDALETALIYLNSSNADKLNSQLQKQHHISLQEFTDADHHKTKLNRYDRTKYLRLPKVDFYQLKIRYETLIAEKARPEENLPDACKNTQIVAGVIKTTDLTMEVLERTVDDAEHGDTPASYFPWLCGIVRRSLETLTMEQLLPYDPILREVFQTITYQRDDGRYFSSRYDRAAVEANIRKAFCDSRSFETKEECIPQSASLLNITNFTPVVETTNPDDYCPKQEQVEKIILDDRGKLKLDKKAQAMMDLAQELGQEDILASLRKKFTSHPQKDRSFHYLPYHTDSSFEQDFLNEVLTFPEVEHLGLEVYYNGDRALTEFKIKCYRHSGGRWEYVGLYTPDFLIFQRKGGVIHKVLIAETKGQAYANDPKFKDRKTFMETEFLRQNNAAFGYERFEYLYLEDSMSERERLVLTQRKICAFFEEG
ncbi:DEAD/DEAH box helicase family protein [Oscillibacter valericigenes]|uniref:DEAD/DEAH box helicase family protein n=1 Tax=Oscillibacter valericigenes TaxID=351091 RepID=A0ABS2FX34_9FIRM|nr:DEAD/DEAH box helicase family protein [Oscillibacter valericigenes]MBM6851998.1 DEAD/DEAH box helicase family protein [Oscillibacter valericigenes]